MQFLPNLQFAAKTLQFGAMSANAIFRQVRTAPYALHIIYWK